MRRKVCDEVSLKFCICCLCMWGTPMAFHMAFNRILAVTISIHAASSKIFQSKTYLPNWGRKIWTSLYTMPRQLTEMVIMYHHQRMRKKYW